MLMTEHQPELTILNATDAAQQWLCRCLSIALRDWRKDALRRKLGVR
jgi:hypothetical protein